MDAEVGRPAGPGPALAVAGLLGLFTAAAFRLAEGLGVLNGVRWGTLQFSAALFLIGWAWMTAGSMSVGALRKLTRRRLVPWALVGWIAWSLAAVVEYRQPPRPTSLVPPAIGIALLVAALAVHRQWRPPGRSMVSIGLVVGLLTFGAAGVTKREWYPFSPFQMYSVAQLDPRSVEVPVVVARIGAREVDITGTLGVATVRELVSDPDPDRVIAALEVIAATRERRTGRSIDAIEIRDQVWTVAPYPAPPTIELTDETTRLSYDRSS